MSGSFVTLADYSAELAKKGKPDAAGIVNALRQQNGLFDVLSFKECNDSGGVEKVPVEGNLPEVSWRILNRGTVSTKGSFKEVSFTCGSLESFCRVDEKIIEICGKEYGSSQNEGHLSAMSNKIATTFFYGDEAATPESFTGLAAYYPAVDNEQVFSAAGSGDSTTSIWFCSFGPRGLYGIYPRGVKCGFQVHYNGIVNEERDGLEIHSYEYQFTWDMGLALYDPRSVARVLAVDPEAVDASDMETAYTALASAYAATAARPGETHVIFANREALAYILKTAAFLGFDLQYFSFKGKIRPHLFGVPIMVCESILNTEGA